MNCANAEELLGARMDGELDADARAAVDAHLASCDGCRARARALAALSEALRAEVRRPAAPPALRATIARSLRAGALPPPRGPRLGRAATALVGAAAGFACALVVLGGGTREPAPDALAAAHSRALVAGALVAVRSSDHHTVKPWLSRHLDFSPPVPDPAESGFPLEGARVERLGGKSHAALVYARRLHAITVFVRPDAGVDEEPRALPESRGFHERAWREGGFSFRAVTDLNDAEFDEFVAAFRAGA